MKKVLLLVAVVATLFSALPLTTKGSPDDKKPEKITAVAYYNSIQMMCGGCTGKVRHRLLLEYGVVSVEPDLKTKDVKVVYEPSKTSPEKIQESFKRFDFLANILNPDEKNVISTVFSSPEINYANDKKIHETLLKIDGVKDVSLSYRVALVSVAYDHTKTSTKQLADALKKVNVNVEIEAVETPL
jgi:copper chaperone CopZ